MIRARPLLIAAGVIILGAMTFIACCDSTASQLRRLEVRQELRNEIIADQDSRDLLRYRQLEREREDLLK